MFSGGLQPRVIPASASAAMSLTNGLDDGTSVNFVVPAGRFSARRRNAAICSRVTD